MNTRTNDALCASCATIGTHPISSVFVHYDSKLQDSLAPFDSGTFVREKHVREIKNNSLCNIKSIDKNMYSIRLYYSVDRNDYWQLYDCRYSALIEKNIVLTLYS